MFKKHIGKSVLIGIALVLLLAACGKDDKKDGAVDKSKLKDTYTVATDSSFVPFEFKEDGKLTGFDIDLMNAIAD